MGPSLYQLQKEMMGTDRGRKENQERKNQKHIQKFM